MSQELLSDDVKDLIRRHIDSVAQLEALLFLRARPGELWDAATTAIRLYAPADGMARSLDRLHTDGFLQRDGDRYRYECSDELRRRVDRLAAAYVSHLISVTNLIHSKPKDIREFSDAFRFGRDR